MISPFSTPAALNRVSLLVLPGLLTRFSQVGRSGLAIIQLAVGVLLVPQEASLVGLSAVSSGTVGPVRWHRLRVRLHPGCP